ncbi:MAG TPA: hypothetical protein PLH57_02405 [Oligoflexia bacterium]|nr:hypothetical protein [Oligoflexia bacterium]
MEHISISEHAVSKPIRLTQMQFDALAVFEKQLSVISAGKEGFFRIKASSWVGDVCLPGLLVSIAPKVGPLKVLRMVVEGDGEANPQIVESPLRPDSDNIWDFLGTTLISEFYKLMGEGLKFDYEVLQENTAYLRGQMQFMQDFLKNFPVRTGIYNRFSEFTPNNDWNKAILWGLTTLTNFTSAEVSVRLTAAADYLAEVEIVANCPDFEMPDAASSYRRILYLVSLVKRFKPVIAGSVGFRGNGIFVDMNDVFEGFVRARLRRVLGKSSFQIPSKSAVAKQLCKNVGLEPDVVITETPGSILAIGDCKYKYDWDFKNSDVFQILAYLEGYRPVTKGYVFVPISAPGLETSSITLPRNRTLIKIGLPAVQLLQDELWQAVAQFLYVELKGKALPKAG